MARTEEQGGCRKFLCSRYTAFVLFASFMIGSIILTGYLTTERCRITGVADDIKTSINCDSYFEQICKKTAYSVSNSYKITLNGKEYDYDLTVTCPFSTGSVAAYYISFVAGLIFLGVVVMRPYKSTRLIYKMLAALTSVGMLLITILMMCTNIYNGHQYYDETYSGDSLTYSNAIYIGCVILVTFALISLMPIVFVAFKRKPKPAKKTDAAAAAKDQQGAQSQAELNKEEKASDRTEPAVAEPKDVMIRL